MKSGSLVFAFLLCAIRCWPACTVSNPTAFRGTSPQNVTVTSTVNTFLVLSIVIDHDTNAPSFSDTSGGFTNDANNTTNDSGEDLYVAHQSGAAAGITTITTTWAGGATRGGMVTLYDCPSSIAASFDTSASSSSASAVSPWTGPSVTPSASGGIVVAVVGMHSAATSVDAPFVLDNTNDGPLINFGAAASVNPTSSAAAEAPTYHFNSSTVTDGLTASYVPSGGGGGSFVPQIGGFLVGP